MNKSKQYEIPKRAVIDAYQRVKANKGSAGIDGIDFEKFEEKLNNNLYKIWNRMSSGSYFPSPVMAVEIPKKSGGTRRLGIPTITDRVAQMVARMYVEKESPINERFGVKVLEPITKDTDFYKTGVYYELTYGGVAHYLIEDESEAICTAWRLNMLVQPINYIYTGDKNNG